MLKFLTAFRGKLSDRKGVSAAEYAILAVGVVIVVGGAVAAFQGSLTSAFERIGSEIENQQNRFS